jgi:hypothetical protein
MNPLVILAEDIERLRKLLDRHTDREIIIVNDKPDNISLLCFIREKNLKYITLNFPITSFSTLRAAVTSELGIKDFQVLSEERGDQYFTQKIEPDTTGKRKVLSNVSRIKPPKPDFDTMWHPFPFTKEQWETFGIKLHLGCGNIYLNDFINVDIDNPTADENFDAFKLKYKNNSVSLILASHLIEHFKFQDHIPLLTEWHRVLKPDGWLIIECPNLEEGCKNFLDEKDDIKRLTEISPQIFGRPDFSVGNIHLSGIWPNYLLNLFRAAGFRSAVPRPPIANNIQQRCMRIDAQK